jgi:hypothetical protein
MILKKKIEGSAAIAAMIITLKHAAAKSSIP